MNSTKVQINGKILSLGKRIGKGGEGEVYALGGSDDFAVKVYTLKDFGDRENKIKAMIQLGLAKQASLVAFPIDYVQNDKGEFIGFVMRLVKGHKPLHELYAPGPRKLHFPHADYRFLVRTALNITKAVASVHKTNSVIGDINHSSLLISPKAVVALIDADSFQVNDNKKQYLCTVGVPEYTPPELQGQRLSSIIRTKTHDEFGLAIVIFQLLFMGRHPFVGTVRAGEIPPLHENIKNYRYVYTSSRNIGMDQPPGTPSISEFHQELANTFEQAFGPNSSNGRPSAEKWIKILESLEQSLVKCDLNHQHFLPKEANECPWCEMEQQLATVLFLPYQFDMAGNYVPISIEQFDVLWKEVESLSLPQNLQPLLPSLTAQPSHEVKNLQQSTKLTFPYLVVAILGLLLLVTLEKALKIYSIPLIVWGLWPKKVEIKPSYEKYINAYETAAKNFNNEQQNWQRKFGESDLQKLKRELLETKNTYKNIIQEKENLIQNYKKHRYEKQLISHLEKYAIINEKIKGIGPARLATLSSYGIDTAADITQNRIINLRGFSYSNFNELNTWRVSKEKIFVYDQRKNELDKSELAKITRDCDKKLIELKSKITESLLNLKRHKRLIEEACNKSDEKINSVYRELNQALTDLKFLGVDPPVVKHTNYSAQNVHIKSNSQNKLVSTISSNTASISSNQKNTRIIKNPSLNSNIPTCHLCGNAMTKRLAKRGRNSGNYFWGCTRYPVCKGTKPI